MRTIQKVWCVNNWTQQHISIAKREKNLVASAGCSTPAAAYSNRGWLLFILSTGLSVSSRAAIHFYVVHIYDDKILYFFLPLFSARRVRADAAQAVHPKYNTDLFIVLATMIRVIVSTQFYPLRWGQRSSSSQHTVDSQCCFGITLDFSTTLHSGRTNTHSHARTNKSDSTPVRVIPFFALLHPTLKLSIHHTVRLYRYA